MKKYLFAIAALVLSVGMSIGFTSCGNDEPEVIVENPTKADLTTPMFLYAVSGTNYLDFWSFTDTEAAYGSMQTVGENGLRIKCTYFYPSWTLEGRTLNLNNEKLYAATKGTYQNVSVIVIEGASYIPSNTLYGGKKLEENFEALGLTKDRLWTVLRESYRINDWVELEAAE